MSAQIIHNLFLGFFLDLTIFINTIQQIRRSDIGGHDQDRILEVYSTSLGIGNTAIIQYLQKYIEYIRMCLLNLIEKYNAVRFPTNGFCQLSALLVSNISRRSSDQSGYRVFLHVLAHVDTNHILLIIEKSLCKGFGKLCFTNTGRSKEQERTDWFGRIFDSCFGTKDGIGYTAHTFLLTDNTFVELIFQMKQFGTLSLCQPCYRNASPTGNDPCDFIVCYYFVDKASVTLFCIALFNFQLLL